MISKGHYKQAEELLRKIAKTNKRTFDEEAFQQLKNEHEEVNNSEISFFFVCEWICNSDHLYLIEYSK
jgi:hypothetical protein